MTERTAQTTRVIVIGGGYAGVLAANRLQGTPGVAVTLVNPRPEFVERIRLHQLAAGNHTATAAYQRTAGRRGAAGWSMAPITSTPTSVRCN